MRRFLLGLVKIALFVALLALALVPLARDQIRRHRMDAAVDRFLDSQARGGEEGLLPVALVEIPKLGETLPVWEGEQEAAEPGGAKGAARLLDSLSRWLGLTGPVDGARLTEWVGLPGGEAARCAAEVDLSGLNRLAPGDYLTLRTATGEAVYEIAQTAVGGNELAWPVNAGGWFALERNGRRVVQARRVSRRTMVARDDSSTVPGWLSGLVYMIPVVGVGLILLNGFEALRRGLKRWKLSRMRL